MVKKSLEKHFSSLLWSLIPVFNIIYWTIFNTAVVTRQFILSLLLDSYRYLRDEYKWSRATILTLYLHTSTSCFTHLLFWISMVVNYCGRIFTRQKLIRHLGKAMERMCQSIIAFTQMASMIAIKRVAASSGNQEVM